MRTLKKRLMFFVILFVLSSLVYSANLGISCSEKYAGLEGCPGECCNCATVCDMDYECGADDGINPSIFFGGKPCCNPDPDGCDVYENLYVEGCKDILEGGTLIDCSGGAPNGVCDPREGCNCIDCLLQQGPCIYGAVCDFSTALCRCAEGKTYCKSSKECVTSLSQCSDFNQEIDCTENCARSLEDDKPSCLCDSCDLKQDCCTSAASCSYGLCKNCQLIDVYWDRTCTENSHIVNVVVDGDTLCDSKEVEVNITEEEEEVSIILGNPLTTFSGAQAIYEWTAMWQDASALPGLQNPKYYAAVDIANILMMSSLSSYEIPLLEVQPCNVVVDSDCDEVCIAGLTEDSCTDAGFTIDEDECCDGEQCCKIGGDECPDSGECAEVDGDGCTEGQASCLAQWDCTPEWWGTSPPVEWIGITENEAIEALEWGECLEKVNPNRIVKERQVCPDSVGNCCTEQGNCYCKMPTDSECVETGMNPATERSCLEEQKFPVFTLNNVLITVILLTLYFMYTFRKKKK